MNGHCFKPLGFEVVYYPTKANWCISPYSFHPHHTHFLTVTWIQLNCTSHPLKLLFPILWSTPQMWGAQLWGFSETFFAHNIVVQSFGVSDSSWPRGLQNARLPGPSPSPRACSNSCPLSWWWVQLCSSLKILGIALLWDWFFFQHSCLEKPMNSMKRQKDLTLKDELPRSIGTQYTTREEQRNSSGRNEEAEPT